MQHVTAVNRLFDNPAIRRAWNPLAVIPLLVVFKGRPKPVDRGHTIAVE
ncbi:MAG TPA: hypothetical protein VHX52_00985 [Steroidobacteraceae bacterium]|nr:hypothetical protein [Steroidobacteraceae bacterium]